MTEFKFNIVGKDGKVIEDLMFDNFDAVADYMLDAADKWYSGLEDPESQMVLSRIEDGKVVYIETARQFLAENREDREEVGEDS
jgi:hypothetical protein